MTVISIANQKGGSGKTTTVSLFAKSISSTGKSVLIIDADPQGGISTIYKTNWEIPNSNHPGLYEIMVGAKPEMGVNVFKTEFENINIIPSDYRLDKIFLSVSPYSIQNALKQFIKNYDYVLIDTPPTIQGITRASIQFSNKIFVPCEISKQSMKPTRYTLDSISEMNKSGAVIFIGWKNPEDKKGFQNNLFRDFHNEFKNELVGHLPKNTSTVSFSSEKKKASATINENVIQTILEVLK